MKKIAALAFGLVLITGCAHTPAPNNTVPQAVVAVPAEAVNEIRNLDIQPGDLVVNPLTISGEALGKWYFEANMPIDLLDANKNVITHGYAMAQGEWMQAGFVPFAGVLTFNLTPTTTATGFIKIMNDNPSGMPENARSYTIPVRLK